MKILWFSHVQLKHDAKGTGSWITSLAPHMVKDNNIELHVAFKSDSQTIEKQKFGNIITYRLPSVEFSKIKNNVIKYFNISVDKRNLKEYLKVIDIVNPDIIQLFGSENDFGMILYHTDVPTIVYVQCIYQAVYKKWFSGLSAVDIKKYSSLKSKLQRNTFLHQYKRHINKSKKEIFYYNNCNYIIGRTEWDKRCVSFLAPHAEYFHCDEALREQFLNNKWNKDFNENEINIVTTIGSSVYKGFETIVETMEILESYLQHKIIWRVIGLSKKDEIIKICRKKYKNRMSSNIILLGKKIDANQMVEYMKKADLFVHPSHIETGSNAISEAQLLGMPVISTFAGGINTTIKDRVTGYLIQEGEPISLASAILYIHKNPLIAKDMGRGAREDALDRHNPKKITNQLINIYKNIVNNNKI